MTLAPLSSDLRGGLDETGTLSDRNTSCNHQQVSTGYANPVLARHVSLAPYQRALRVLHPEAFARHLAGRVVSPGDMLGFMYAGRVRIDFIVTGCLPDVPAVQITGETAFEVDVNPVHGDQEYAREPQEQ